MSNVAGGFTISTEVVARIDNFVNGLKTAGRQAQAFSNKLEKSLGDADPFSNLSNSIQTVGKDWQNITRGILISQFFYQTIQGAQNAAAAIWTYTDSLNAARVAFGNLFNNYPLAEEFVNVLQDYATRSPFNFADVEAAAKQLRAYGIQAENMMFVMEGIGNLAAVTGDYSVTFDRVARAIGQINSKGKLMGEEMRQLAEAGLDVNAVYQRLGVEAGNVAAANIDAATAINTIIDVLNDNYGDAVAAANSTMQGILANMRDLALSTISSIIQPVYDAVHSMLYTIQQGFNEFQSLFQSGGLGNAIAGVFGPEALAVIQNLMAVLAQLGQSILQVAYPAVRILGQAFLALITAMTPVIAAISTILSAIGSLANYVLNNAVAMRILQGVLLALAVAFVAAKVAAAGMLIVQVISKVVAFFSNICVAASAALQVMSLALAQGAAMSVAAGRAWVAFASALNVNPIILAITVITALIAALVGLHSILGGVSSVAANMSSFDPNNFLGSIPAASGDINKFNNRLSDTNGQLNDLADGLGDAGKAADKAVEGLLSFDEVFSLPDKTDPTLSGSGLGGIGDVGDVPMPDLGDIGAGIPDVPLFDWDKLLGYDQLPDIWEKVKSFFSNLKWPDIGAAITAGITTMLSSIGIGNIVAAFELMVSEGFSKVGWELLTDPNTWKTLLRSLKQGLIAALLSLGFEFVFDIIGDKLREAGLNAAANIVDKFAAPFASALATFIVSKNPFVAMGAFVISAIMQSIEEGISTGDWTGLAEGVLGGIAVALSAAMKSMAGGLLGVGGIVVGMLFDSISQSLEEQGNTEGAEIASKAGTILSTALSGAGIGLAFGPIGAAVGAGVGAILGTIMAFWTEISGWWTETAWPAISGLGSTIGGAFNDIWTALTDTVSGFFQGIVDTASAIGEKILEIKDSILEFFANAIEWLLQAGADLIQGLWNGVTDAWDSFWEWIQTVPEKIGTIFEDAINWLLEAGRNILQGLWNGITEVWNNFWAWVETVPDNIGYVFSGAGNWLLNAGGDILQGLWNGAQNVWNSVTNWFWNLPNSITNIFSGAWNWLTNAGSDIISGLWAGLKSGWDWVCNQVSGWGRWLASIKGPESYDKRLLTPNGRWITESLYKGLTDEFPTVLDAMSGLAPMMADAFSQNSDAAIREANNYQPHRSSNTGQVETVDNPYLTNTGSSAGSTDAGRPIMYVGTLIANKQGLRELQKQLDIVTAENSRWR